jgi:hypothetical protein
MLGIAQQPSHYTIGAQELDGIDIYDMLHARDGSYLIATGSGLIRFDGYRFGRAQCPDMLMGSVFNLVEDSAGNVYCHNLSGQVFRYADGQCALLLTLPDSLVAADMDLAIDDLGRLIISASRLMAVGEEGSLELLSSERFFGAISELPDGALAICPSGRNAFTRLSKGELLPGPDLITPPADGRVPGLLAFNDSVYAFHSNSCEVFRMEADGLRSIIDPSAVSGKEHLFKLHVTSDALWFASGSLGVLRVDRHFRADNNGAFLFPNTFISTIMEDDEGNILLGTFGKGIMVIPDQTTHDLSISGLNDDVISVARSANGTLYFGTRSGRLLARDTAGAVRPIREAQVKSMEALHCLGTDMLLIGESNGMLIHVPSGRETLLEVSSIKDMAVMGADSALIASNIGAFLLRPSTGEVTKVPELSIRHYCIGYDPQTASIYSGTSKGLTIRQRSGAIRTVRLRGKDVIVRHLLAKGGKVYAATADNGLLVFAEDSMVAQWSTATGLLSDQLTQLAAYHDRLVVATSIGIQLLDGEGKTLRTITRADGLNASKILDLEVNGDELWVVHSSGVQKVMLDVFRPFGHRPELVLKSVLVNDSISAPLTQHDFKADQQKFTFEVSSNSLRYRSETTYHYRLEGAETAWRTANHKQNIIEYRSLSPGTYTFLAKAVCRGMESDVVTYTFTIATPFYKAWWFYLLLSVGAVLMLVFWFRRRLKRHQRLAEQQNELNASKLTAIRSQMNPHFIFNALNSIQSLVLKGDVDNSYTYITKFANLVRRTLNYSDKEFIDFSEEIKLIELYLTLERLRFKEDFEFTMNTDGIDDVMMPPMLIQPFIENALVHGLLHRNSTKRIHLDFELKDVLICTITDNGVGRAKAKAIKERQRSDHESFSVNAIRTRFELLERYYEGKLGFDYEDLMDNGVAAGTRVTLRIPVKRKF